MTGSAALWRSNSGNTRLGIILRRHLCGSGPGIRRKREMASSASIFPYVGVFDLFRVGIGPSSSHTVGPMRAAGQFLQWAEHHVDLAAADRIRCDLFGSLALTGIGHATDTAVIAGLHGAVPDKLDPDGFRRKPFVS